MKIDEFLKNPVGKGTIIPGKEQILTNLDYRLQVLQKYKDIMQRKPLKNTKKGIFTIVNDEGKEIECEILFTFDSDETKKSYIVYTDNTLDEEGSTKVYASVYDPTGQNPALMPIETEKEWLVIENILSSVQQKVEEASQED